MRADELTDVIQRLPADTVVLVADDTTGHFAEPAPPRIARMIRCRYGQWREVREGEHGQTVLALIVG